MAEISHERQDDVALVRASVPLIRAEKTAALRFEPGRVDSERSLQEILAAKAPRFGERFARIRSARRAIVETLALSEVGGPLGCIDFVRERSFYSTAGGGWSVLVPGVEYIGEPGQWEEVVLDSAMLEAHDPFWLLRLIGAVGEATEAGRERVLGKPCRRFATLASLPLATAGAERVLQPPAGYDQLDLERLAVDVWLDSSGRLRRATLHGTRFLIMLELSRFGVPLPIELPARKEIVEED
jgi:hypothetical protein